MNNVKSEAVAQIPIMGRVTCHPATQKDWEIIADRLSKAGWSLGWVSAVNSEGEQSGLLMPTATTEGVSLCMPMKSSARLLSSNVRC